VDSSLDMKYSEISACVHAAWISRSTAVIANCTIACNLLDGLAISANSTTLVKNSVISFNGGVGVRSDTPNTQVYYSNVYGNSSSDYLGIVPAEECISVDPLFRDISLLDFRLMPGSACIDAGDPNEVDPGTDSRIDMGCWPYNTPTAP
ncbi:MAG: right-handed parallel beta-helix repeat-containing protein, partial [Armatimonadetes bacterium]|nr:right-handed parallel beta-helix repeat-containing protein [Armatimonadota bacterium]